MSELIHNIKLLIEYDGTNYHGWQRQANLPTIQQTLEDVLTHITKQSAKVTGAGRTDSGVHAIGQAASFKTTLQIKETSWVEAINSLIPHDIRIKRAEYVPQEFNARYSARGKKYQYIILNSEQMSPFLRNYSWHIKRPLDISAMKEASGYLIGTHDFSSFRASECSAKSPVRTLEKIEVVKRNLYTPSPPGPSPSFPSEVEGAMLIPPPQIEKPGGGEGEGGHGQRVGADGTMLLLTFEARSFLQHMVRNIVGTLAEVGRGRFKPADVKSILEKKDRRHAGQIAQPQGLFLVEIRYE